MVAPQSSWEERYKKFMDSIVMEAVNHITYGELDGFDLIKSFIRSELSTAKEEGYATGYSDGYTDATDELIEGDKMVREEERKAIIELCCKDCREVIESNHVRNTKN